MNYFTKNILMYEINKGNTLLVNTLTSALDIIDNETKGIIDNIIKNNFEVNEIEDKNLYNSLKNRGYIFENRKEEEAIRNNLKKADSIIKNSENFSSFTICPTMGCNLRCTYCFESEKQHKDFKLMTDKQLDTILNFILQEKEKSNDNISIKIFGGEPLLGVNKSIIKRILEFGNQNKIKVAIITNGTNIKQYLELLDKYKEIISMQITLDGDKNIHDIRRIRVDGSGTFDCILSNIDFILKLGIPLSLRINVDKGNIYTLKNLKDTFENNNWNIYKNLTIYASPVIDFSGDMDDCLTESEFLEIILDEKLYGEKDSLLKRIVSPGISFMEAFFNTNTNAKPWKLKYCEATSGRDLCFSPDGEITTCLVNIGKGKLTVGTYDDEKVIIDQADLKVWSNRTIFRMDKCSDCKYALICGGGCPVKSLERAGNIDSSICNDIENTIKTYVERVLKPKIEV